MASFAKMTLSALALQCAMLSGAFAKAPLSDNVHTETAAAQEIGSMTSDGHLVYSMNYCTVIQTTSCAVSMSTGVPIPESSDGATDNGGGADASSTVAYPAPSHDHGGGSGGESPSVPGEGAEPTSPAGDDGAVSTATATDAVVPSDSETASGPVTETGGEATATDGGEDATGTATDTAATGDASGAANAFGVGMLDGLIGLVCFAMACML